MAKRPSKRDILERELFELIKKVKYENDETAYTQLYNHVKSYIDVFRNRFMIMGLGNDDIEQECLFALRYKAIDDFNPTRGKFKTFAVLCIKRHLYSIIKGNNQYKKKALNVSLSLDDGNEEREGLKLRNVVASTNMSVDEKAQQNEEDDIRESKLEETLSDFERDVFALYKQRYRYDEIVEILRESGRKKVDIKSIDNASQRLKQKARKLAESEDLW